MNKILARKIIVYGFYILLATIASFGLTDIVKYKGVSPEYFVVLCVIIGYFYGVNDVIPLAIISGFIKDIFAGRIIGLSVLLFLYIGLLAAILFKRYITKNILVALSQIVIATTIYAFSIYLLLYLVFNISYSFIEYSSWVITQRFLPMILLNIIVGVIFYLILKLINPYSKNVDIYDEVVSTKISKI